MSSLSDLLLSHLPSKRKTNSHGWITHNAQCCHHRGHRPDTKMRGNLLITPDGQLSYNCYNCQFKFRFEGTQLSRNLEQYLSWLGVDAWALNQVKTEIWKLHLEGGGSRVSSSAGSILSWPTVELPPHSQSLVTLMESGCDDPDFVQVINYLASRGPAALSGYDYYWSSSRVHHMNQRLILPFKSQGKTVGYTARYSGSPPSGVPRYWNSSIPAGFLFNNSQAEIPERKFLIITEGPFDAISVQGVAALGSSLNEHQVQWLLNQPHEKVLLPDRELTNQNLIDTALNFGWSVSFPEWETHVKDGADACVRYGQIYTIASVLRSRTSNPIEIGLKRQMFLGKK